MQVEIGSFIAQRYRVDSLLGKGGMGEVYLAHDKTQNRQVALKFLNEKQSRIPDKRQRFQKEFDLLTRLRHANIIAVYEEGEIDPGIPFYSMEYVQGISLADRLKDETAKGNKGLPTHEVLAILRELAEALIHIHAHGVIHHDLKPDNILLLERPEGTSIVKGSLKLLDFGIAILKDRHSAEESAVGTLHYKSPEQIKSKKLDYTADIYSFGAVAYELFSGEKPFDVKDGGNNMAVVTGVTLMHAAGKIPLVKNLSPRIDKIVNRMIQICMAKDPRDRYQSMEEVLGRIKATEDALEKPAFLEAFINKFRSSSTPKTKSN